MATSFKFSGPSKVAEGSNATVTVTRQGDLSETYYVDLHPLNYWGVVSPSQQISADDISVGENMGTKRLTFAPGQSKASASWEILKDGVSEPKEFMTVGYNIYKDTDGILGTANVGIDNSDNPWGESKVGPWTILITDEGENPDSVTPFYNEGNSAPEPMQSFPKTSVTSVNIVNYNISGDNNFVNFGTITNNVNFSNFGTINNIRVEAVATTNNIIGSSKRDILTGTSQNDLMRGGKDDDIIRGGKGDDLLFAGKGSDELYGGEGANTYDALQDGSPDKISFKADGKADLLRAMDSIDRVFINGGSSLSFGAVDGGIGIFDRGILEAIYTGGNLTAEQLSGQVSLA